MIFDSVCLNIGYNPNIISWYNLWNSSIFHKILTYSLLKYVIKKLQIFPYIKCFIKRDITKKWLIFNKIFVENHWIIYKKLFGIIYNNKNIVILRYIFKIYFFVSINFLLLFLIHELVILFIFQIDSFNFYLITLISFFKYMWLIKIEFLTIYIIKH